MQVNVKSSNLHVLNMICLVKPRQLCKSMMATKSIHPALTTRQQLERWIDILAVEMFSRLCDHYDEHRRWPQALSVSKPF
jgi:hypothetical protein